MCDTRVCETINQLVIIAIIAGIRTFTTISIQNYWYGSHCFVGNNRVYLLVAKN